MLVSRYIDRYLVFESAHKSAKDKEKKWEFLHFLLCIVQIQLYVLVVVCLSTIAYILTLDGIREQLLAVFSFLSKDKS